jgi:hypothetical protein
MQIQTDFSCGSISKGPLGCFKTWRITKLETIGAEFGTTDFADSADYTNGICRKAEATE